MLFEYFGYASGILITLSFVPYLIGIFRHETKPERASWFIWSLLGGISFFSQLSKGATHSLWLSGVQTLGDGMVFFLSIRYGIGGFIKRDMIALVLAFLSLVVWYFTKEAAYALFIVILIDGTSAILTMLKTHEYPTSEPLSAWILTALGGLFGIFAVGSSNVILLSYPIYTFVINCAIVLTILWATKLFNLKLKQ